MQVAAGSRELLQQRTERVPLSSSSSRRTGQRRSLRCQASKTTSGRATTSSKSRAGTTSSKPPAPAPLPGANKQQDRVTSLRERVAGVLDHLTPKQEGDIGDVIMMSLSMAVLIYLSMQLYRLYAWTVFSASMFS